MCLNVGRTWPYATILQVIGRGSFGKVMLVRKKDTKAIYAMKILRKENIIARNQVEHTKAERAILESLSHPFLVKMRYAFQTPTKLYLVRLQGGGRWAVLCFVL